MNKFINNLPKKPEDWPANERESSLDAVLKAIENFVESPDFKTKEILLSLCGDYDYTQVSMLGLDRQTEYEAFLINTIWFYASTTGIQTVIMFLYEQIAKSARSHKHVCMFKKMKNLLFQHTNYFGNHLDYSICVIKTIVLIQTKPFLKL